jgi:hypothetical protein
MGQPSQVPNFPSFFGDFLRLDPRSSPGGSTANSLILLGFVVGTLVTGLPLELDRRAQTSSIALSAIRTPAAESFTTRMR